MTQTIQVAGSLCVLLPFMLVQFKKMRPTSVSYLTFNAVGSTVLAVLAALSSQWGLPLARERVGDCVMAFPWQVRPGQNQSPAFPVRFSFSIPPHRVIL